MTYQATSHHTGTQQTRVQYSVFKEDSNADRNEQERKPHTVVLPPLLLLVVLVLVLVLVLRL